MSVYTYDCVTMFPGSGSKKNKINEVSVPTEKKIYMCGAFWTVGKVTPSY